MGVTRLDYCQYLLVSQINYTLTNFADHTERFSHEAVNRFLRSEKLRPSVVWENVKGQVVTTSAGYLVFDDTVVNKQHSFAIELVRRQWSGNAKGVIKGTGVVTCLYVNPETDQFWLIDYRLYNPEGDGKSKLDHVQEMLKGAVYSKALPFQAVLMDSWYATKDVMLQIEDLKKVYYCPLKTNRLVDDSTCSNSPTAVSIRSVGLDEEQTQGKRVKLRGFPERPQGAAFPSCGVHPPHGLRCNEQRRSDNHASCARGVQPCAGR